MTGKSDLYSESLRYFSAIARQLFPDDYSDPENPIIRDAERQEFVDLAMDFLVDAIAKGRVTREQLSFRIILHRTQREFFRRQARRQELEARSLDEPIIGPDGEKGSLADFVGRGDGLITWETVLGLVSADVHEALRILASKGSVNALAKQVFGGNWRKARKFVVERVVPELARVAALLGFAGGDPEESVKALLYALRDKEVIHGPLAKQGPGGGPSVGHIGTGGPSRGEGRGGDLGD